MSICDDICDEASSESDAADGESTRTPPSRPGLGLVIEYRPSAPSVDRRRCGAYGSTVSPRRRLDSRCSGVFESMLSVCGGPEREPDAEAVLVVVVG
jgi:hypothetical protein